MALRTYDAKDVNVLIDGQLLSGYADGTFCNVEYNEDLIGTEVGSAGEVALSVLNNPTGTVTLTVFRGSQASRVLDTFRRRVRNRENFIFNLSVIEARSGTRAVSAQCWVQSNTPLPFSRNLDSEEWVLAFADIDVEREELPAA
jgi:hypothetical protein